MTTNPQVRKLSTYYVEGFFVFFWMAFNALSVSVLPKEDWWLGFQFFYLGTATNITFFAMVHYLQIITSKPSIAYKLPRFLLMNAGISLVMFSQSYVWYAAKIKHLSLVSSHFAQPSFTHWFVVTKLLKNEFPFAKAAIFIGLALIIILTLWLLLEFVFAFAIHWSVVSFPMTAYACSFALLCLTGAMSLDIIQGAMILNDNYLPLHRISVILLLLGWLITPFITAVATFSPAVFENKNNSLVYHVTRDWVPLALWATPLFLLSQFAWLFTTQSRVPFSVAIGIIGFPAIILAITFTRLSRLILQSLTYKHLSLISGLVWIAVFDILFGIWNILIDNTVYMKANNHVTVILLVTGLQTAVLSLVLYLIQGFRKVGVAKRKFLVVLQLSTYFVGSRLVQLDGIDYLTLPKNIVVLVLITMAVAIAVPALFGLPRTPPGELSHRETLLLALANHQHLQDKGPDPLYVQEQERYVHIRNSRIPPKPPYDPAEDL